MRATVAYLAIIAVVGFACFQWGERNEAEKNKAALDEVNRLNAEETERLERQVKQVTENAERERQEIDDNLLAADDTVASLRSAIRDANTRADTPAACRADAAAARSLLASCASEFRDMARQADQLRATVLGWQDYYKVIQPE